MHAKLWLTVLSVHSMAAFALAGSYGGSFTRSRAGSGEGGTFSPHGEYNG